MLSQSKTFQVLGKIIARCFRTVAVRTANIAKVNTRGGQSGNFRPKDPGASEDKHIACPHGRQIQTPTPAIEASVKTINLGKEIRRRMVRFHHIPPWAS